MTESMRELQDLIAVAVTNAAERRLLPPEACERCHGVGEWRYRSRTVYCGCPAGDRLFLRRTGQAPMMSGLPAWIVRAAFGLNESWRTE